MGGLVPTVAALIPAHNEALHIGTVVRQAAAHVPVLVVDDGSTDDTSQLAERAGATVIRQMPNQGKGQALRTGFRQALAKAFDAVVALDGDGQHDPSEIPSFLRTYSSGGADLIIGKRTFSQMPLIRRTSNTLGTVAFSWAMSQPIADNQSGYRLVSRRLMAATLDSREAGFEFEVEMIVRCVELGLRLDWVPIRTIYADEESHIRPWHHLVHFVRITWQARRRIKRARLDTSRIPPERRPG
jgi:glycosyltransferase involved in cell wall biosynthesis